MKALEYLGPWEFRIEQVPVPEIRPGELLMRSEAVGICGSDVHGFTGESGRRKPGMVMGHEVVASVVKAGAQAPGFQPGERVAIFPLVGCGTCDYCRRGLEHVCPDKRILGVNAGRWGAMAEFFQCDPRQAFPISADTETAVGLFAEPLAVAIHAVNLMRPREHDAIAIVGAGTIGLALTIALRDRGVSTIFILDMIEEKLALAATFGAQPVNVGREEPAAAIQRLAGRARLPGVFEAVGAAATVRTAYDLCDFGGTVVLVGNLAKEFTLPLQGVTSNEITLRGSYGFSRDDFRHAVGLLPKYQPALKQLITGTCTLEETPRVMTELARGERDAVKMVIRPSA